MTTNLYKVSDNVNAMTASDLNQLADAMSAANDIGTMQTFPVLSPPTALTASVNTTSGNLSGAYQYKVAFVTGYWQGATGSGTLRTQGNTGGGTPSNTVSPSAQQVDLSAIPVGPAGTVARILYRTKSNGSSFFFVTQITDNVTTSWTDNVADASLGAAMPGVNTTGTSLSVGKDLSVAGALSVVGTSAFTGDATFSGYAKTAKAFTIDSGNGLDSLYIANNAIALYQTKIKSGGTYPFTENSNLILQRNFDRDFIVMGSLAGIPQLDFKVTRDGSIITRNNVLDDGSGRALFGDSANGYMRIAHDSTYAYIQGVNAAQNGSKSIRITGLNGAATGVYTYNNILDDTHGNITAVNTTDGMPAPYIAVANNVSAGSNPGTGRMTVYHDSQATYSGKVAIEPWYYDGAAYNWLTNAFVVGADKSVRSLNNVFDDGSGKSYFLNNMTVGPVADEANGATLSFKLGSNPVAGNIAFGDGTGWMLKFITKNATPVTLLTLQDNGAFTSKNNILDDGSGFMTVRNAITLDSANPYIRPTDSHSVGFTNSAMSQWGLRVIDGANPSTHTNNNTIDNGYGDANFVGQLTVNRGATNAPGIVVTGTAGWASGMQFNNTTATTGRNWGIYSGSEGDFHFVDIVGGFDFMKGRPGGILLSKNNTLDNGSGAATFINGIQAYGTYKTWTTAGWGVPLIVGNGVGNAMINFPSVSGALSIGVGRTNDNNLYFASSSADDASSSVDYRVLFDMGSGNATFTGTLDLNSKLDNGGGAVIHLPTSGFASIKFPADAAANDKKEFWWARNNGVNYAFEVWNKTDGYDVFIVHSDNSVTTRNNTLDNGSGGATFTGTVTLSSPAPYFELVEDTGQKWYYGLDSTHLWWRPNSTGDSNAFQIFPDFSILTKNNTLDDGSGNAIFARTIRSNLGTSIGGSAHFGMNSSGYSRFNFGLMNAENGGNAGSDLRLWAYDDAGAFLGTYLSIERSTGNFQTKNNILDDGTGNMSIVDALYFTGAGHIAPAADNYAGFTNHARSQWLLQVNEATGYVNTKNNLLDDGNGFAQFTKLAINSSLPSLILKDYDAALNNKIWHVENSAGTLFFSRYDDDDATNAQFALQLQNNFTVMTKNNILDDGSGVATFTQSNSSQTMRVLTNGHGYKIDVSGVTSMGMFNSDGTLYIGTWDTADTRILVNSSGNSITLSAGSVNINGFNVSNPVNDNLFTSDANSLTVTGFYSTPSSFTGSPYAGTDGSNQGYIVHHDWSESHLYALQEFTTINATPIARKYRAKIAGTWSSWFAMLQDFDRSAADVNTILQSGVHGLNSANTNAPPSGSYLAMITAQNGTDVGMQIAGGYTSDNLYFRGWYSFGASWTAWRKVWHDGIFDPSTKANLSGAAFSGLITAGGSGRQLTAASWCDLSGSSDGYAVFGNNVYRDNSTHEMKYANTHGSLGARGILLQNGGGIKVFDTGTSATTAGAAFTPTLYDLAHSGNIPSGYIINMHLEYVSTTTSTFGNTTVSIPDAGGTGGFRDYGLHNDLFKWHVSYATGKSVYFEATLAAFSPGTVHAAIKDVDTGSIYGEITTTSGGFTVVRSGAITTIPEGANICVAMWCTGGGSALLSRAHLVIA